jgi:hypothetical protein
VISATPPKPTAQAAATLSKTEGTAAAEAAAKAAAEASAALDKVRARQELIWP